MGLMETMRSGTDSTFMQVILALVVISFVAWGVNQGQDKTQAVAVVNGEWIMDTELARAVRDEERRGNRALSEDEQLALRERVRQELIRQEVLNQEAERLGLAVSDTEIARFLLSVPAFHDENGLFDQDRYMQIIKRQGYTRGEFESRIREQLLREKLRNLVFFGVTVSEPVLREAFERQSARIDLQYVRIRPALFQDDVEVTAEMREQVLTEDAERVKAEYDRDFSRQYDLPERVHVQLIRLPLREDGVDLASLAERLGQVRAEIAAGADFEQMARRWSEHPSAVKGGDLGLTAVGQLDEAARQGVEGVEPGGLSEVITTDDEVRLYRVVAREPARVIPFEEARDEIADRLIKQERAPALAAEYADRLLAEWQATGEPPEEMLMTQGLTALDTGPIPLEPEPSPFAPPSKMVRAAERAEPGQVLPEVYDADGTLWVGELTSRQDPDMDLFETEIDQIRDEVLMSRRAEFYDEWVTARVAAARIE